MTAGPKPLVLRASTGAPESIFCAECGRLRLPTKHGATCAWHGAIGPGLLNRDSGSMLRSSDPVVAAFRANRLFWFDGVKDERITADHVRGLGF